jgi:hypothetical protein
VAERETKKEKKAGVCITAGRITRNEANSLHAAMREMRAFSSSKTPEKYIV